MSDAGQGQLDSQIPIETENESRKQIFNDLDSDVSNEYDDQMSWPSDESDYPHSDSEDDIADEESSETSQEKAIKWLTHPQPIGSIPFTGKPGLKCQPHGTDPIYYFNLLATDEFYSLLLNETNKNATKILKGPNSSQISGWVELKLKELKKFLGIFYHMGYAVMERLDNYWDDCPLLGPTKFSRYMTYDRFLQILITLHFSEDPEENDHSLTSHIQKVKPLIDLFNRTMKNIHGPSRQLLVGDSMLLRMKDLMFRVHVKHKTHSSGLKLYMLQESSGLIQKFLVYSRDDDEELMDESYEQIIQTLMQDYVDTGHSLYPDVLHNSIQLTQYLLKKKTYCTGGLRVARKYNPIEVLKANLKKGESIERYNEDNICVIKWKDRSGPPALMISSEFDGQMMEVTTRKGVKRKKPVLIEKYNQFIKSVSDQEELITYFPCEHVKMRWYKKLSTYIFHLMMANAYYLIKMYGNRPRMPFDAFRMEVINELMQVDVKEP